MTMREQTHEPPKPDNIIKWVQSARPDQILRLLKDIQNRELADQPKKTGSA